MYLMILEALLIASSCSLDAFAASFAYGAKRIRIPFLSGLLVILICSGVFALSLWGGSAIRPFLPPLLTKAAAFAVLFLIGLLKLLDCVTKSIIQRHYRRNDHAFSKEVSFRFLNFSFILNLYANPEDADVNENKIISPTEAMLLSLSLSLDGIAVGFGAALGETHLLPVVCATLLSNLAAVLLGSRLGRLLSLRLSCNISWISGAILMGLALFKLIWA